MAANGPTRSAPRIGIVGFGRMAELFHWPGLTKAGWRIEAVLDVTESRRAKASELGVPHVCSTMREFLKVNFDAALIATHSSVRYEVIAPLAKAGRHLLVEKPIATTGREALRICDRCDEAGVLLGVYHNRRFDPDAMRVRQLIDSNYIGTPFHVENRLFANEPATAFGAEEFNRQWRETSALGGGSMLDWGPHLVDQTLALLPGAGPVISVSADIRNVRYGDADDHFMMTLVFENGARAMIGKSDVCPAGISHKWLVIGDRGSAVADWDRVSACSYERGDRVVESRPKPPSLHRNFLESIAGEADLLVTGREGARVCEIFDAARRSARALGRTVRVYL